MSSQASPILYPPTIIGHITKDISDLFAQKVRDRRNIKVLYGCQLNGHPHLGTAISIICSYAIAKHLQQRFQLSVSFVFNALENGPGEKREVEGITYQKMLCDTYQGNRSLSDIYLDSFSELLSQVSEISGIPHTALLHLRVF